MLKNTTALRSAQGYSLVEVLVAMVLFSIAALGYAGLTVGSIKGVDQAKQRTLATTLAQDKIEEVRNGGVAACTPGSLSQGAVTYTLGCAQAGGPNGSTNITVTVTWTNLTSQSVVLQTRI